ncbi:MAG: flagellar biosynthesis protein FlhB [Alphaproteobacteria bacterium]
MMEDQDQEQKTEEATGKKLDEARDSGQLPISREVGNWFLFAGILATLGIMAPILGETLMSHLRVFFEMPHQLQIGDHSLQRVLANTLLGIGLPVLLIFFILMVAVIAGTMVQTGFFASTAPLKLHWDRLNPAIGLNSLLSKNSLVEMGKGFLKIVVVGYVAYTLLRPYVDKVEPMIGRDINGIGGALQEEAFSLMLSLMFVISIIALIDLVYRRHVYFKGLRMTKQEVKDERKQSEGDPMIKMRIRQIRMEKARKRMMSNVPKADVVLTNPTHYAVALRYDTAKMNAPTVVAKGADLVALRIRELAEKSNVPLVANPPLARALYQSAEVDEEISPQHYRAVAEVISYVYKLKKKHLH